MSRARISDPLQAGRFHVLDVSISFPPVLIPLFGFSRVSLPSLNIELMSIKEGNYEFPRKVIKGATVGPVLLERGLSLIDSDFFDWIRKAVIGQTWPKNLLIIQFHGLGAGSVSTESLPGGSFLPFELALRLPGRGFFLKNCRPTQYRPGTDLDAMDQSVSLASLEIECEEFEDLNFGI